MMQAVTDHVTGHQGSLVVQACPSLTELADCYGEMVRRVAFCVTRSDAAAQDITQDVFVRVMRCGGFDSTRGSLEQWLVVVARHTAIDWIRRESAHDSRVARFEGVHSVESTVAVEDTAIIRVQADQIRTAVAQLPATEREVVSLAYFGGLTYRQVATRLGIAEGTVKSRIRSALTRLSHTIEALANASD